MKPSKGIGAGWRPKGKPIDDILQFYPTPPWATRALFEHVIGEAERGESAWEPAAGEGHMAEVLREYFPVVFASDIKDYGKGYEVGSFIGHGADVIPSMLFADWVITNPPFTTAGQFLERALKEARRGVAMLLRLQWLEGERRYNRLLKRYPPAKIACFVERVPMVAGRWDPEVGSAMAYAWIVWRVGERPNMTEFTWIPPGQKRALTKPDDRRRFTTEQPLDGLFAELASPAEH